MNYIKSYTIVFENWPTCQFQTWRYVCAWTLIQIYSRKTIESYFTDRYLNPPINNLVSLSRQ